MQHHIIKSLAVLLAAAFLPAVASAQYFESDGNEDSPRIVTVTQDTVFEAIFAHAEGIDNVGTMEFTVSPNPTTGRLTVQLSQQESYKMTIYDVNGKALWNSKGES